MSYPKLDQESGSGHFFERAVEEVRSAGLRLTPQRSAILELFERRGAHMTPQGIFEALKDEVKSLSLATVYNSLEVFEEIGVVDRVCDDGQAYFDPNTNPHQHAVCQQCGEIFDLRISASKLEGFVDALSSSREETDEFEIDTVDIWLKGLCSDCQG